MKTLATVLKGINAIGGRRIRLAAAVLAALGVSGLVQLPTASAGEASKTGTIGRYTIGNHPDMSFADCFYQPFSSAQYPNGRRLVPIQLNP